MNIVEYQKFTATTAVYPQAGTKSFLENQYLTLGLVNEAGEYAGKIKKLIRGDDVDPDSVAGELADVLWYLARLCDVYNTDLEQLADYSYKKLTDRKERGVIKGSGDAR